MRCGGPWKATLGHVWYVAAVLLAVVVSPLVTVASGAETTSALRIELSGAPQRVFASDGREHIEYDLIVTDAFTGTATLRSLEVRGGGRLLLSYNKVALAARTLLVGTSKPTDGRVAPASTMSIQVDIVLPRSAGRSVPRSLTNQITYSIPKSALARSIIGTTTVKLPPVRVDRQSPIVIASPLRGTWLDGNGCCDDPSSPHRQLVLATSSGGYITPEMFAIDWVRLEHGRLYKGDGRKNSDWPTFGSPLYAVANGTVVSVTDGTPDIPPRTDNPLLATPHDYAGNSVLLRIGVGLYACYAHMKRGSVVVRRGQRVRVGQRIGLVGNSGNTTGPHLHFGIERRPDCLSQGEPFEIDRYTLDGTVDPASVPPHFGVIGPRRRERRSLPLIRSVETLFPPAR
jgi:Peptidase family M23